MKIQGWLAMCLAGALLSAPAIYAASSSDSVSATCKDGSSWSGKSHSGACRGHGGVQSWSDSGASSSAQTSTGETSTSTHKSHSKKTGSAEASGGMSSSSMSATSAAGSVGAMCKDGSHWTGKSHSGACRGHGGVQSWGGESNSAAPASGSMTSTNSSAPSNGNSGSVTATCKDGTTWTGKSHSGACRGHKGVQSWSGESNTTAAATPPPMAPPAAAPMSPRPSNTPINKPAARPAPTPATPAPGGGAGKVWVNASSKVYHCQNDRWYGKTKNGEYMSESQAKAQGYRPDHGKACS